MKGAESRQADTGRAVAPGQRIAELLRRRRREGTEVGPVLLLDREVPSLVREAAERTFHESIILRTREQLEQRQGDSGSAVRIAGQILLLLRPEGGHRRPRPGIAVAMGVCQQMLAEASRFGEITIVAEALIDGAESGDRAGGAADDVERHRSDLVAELAVDQPQRILLQRRFIE